jgi:exopolysaccharide production protein ExoQ
MVITNKTVDAVLFILLLLSMWSPGEDWPSWVALARYAMFLSASGFLILTAYLTVGLRVQLSIEAAFVASFLAYVSFSALWSVPSADTYIKALLILSALLTAMSISSLKRLDQTFRVIFSAAATIVVASAAVSILVPSVGLENSWEHAGKWRGLLAQKNGLGSLAAMTVVIGLALPMKPRTTVAGQRWALAGRSFIIATAAIAVLMAGSRGGQLVCLVGIASLLIAYAPKLLQRLLLVGIVLASVPIINLAVSTFWIDADKIGIVGLTIDTNSRTTIWEYGLRQMQGRELFGFGVNGFWTEERMAAFQDAHGWVLDNFHNGYITLFVENGMIGFSLFVLGLAFVYLLLIITIGAVKDRIAALAFAHMNMFGLGNLVENDAGRSTSVSIIIFTVTAFSLRAHVAEVLQHGVRSNPLLTTATQRSSG